MNLDEYDLFRTNKCSLRECSRDDSKPDHVQYMTDSMLNVVNFDMVKRKYTNGLGHSEDDAASVDTLMQRGKDVVFVEFKNGKVNNRNLNDKIRDSLLIFLDITGEKLSDMRDHAIFILVSNEKDNQSKHQIGNTFMRKGGQELVLHGVEKWETLYFQEVHTYNKSEFADYLNEKQ